MLLEGSPGVVTVQGYFLADGALEKTVSLVSSYNVGFFTKMKMKTNMHHTSVALQG